MYCPLSSKNYELTIRIDWNRMYNQFFRNHKNELFQSLHLYFLVGAARAAGPAGFP